MIEIKQAEEQDTFVIEDILLDVYDWLESINAPIWSRKEIMWKRLSEEHKITDFYIAYMNGEAVGCMALIDFDPDYWNDLEKGESLFIHKFAVKREGAGKGISVALIDYAKNECKRLKISALRLDTHMYRPKVRAMYERNGFKLADEKLMFGKYYTAFYVWNVER